MDFNFFVRLSSNGERVTASLSISSKYSGKSLPKSGLVQRCAQVEPMPLYHPDVALLSADAAEHESQRSFVPQKSQSSQNVQKSA